MASGGKKICEEYLEGWYGFEVIDSYQDRTRNPAGLLHAAPTLIRKRPRPLR